MSFQKQTTSAKKTQGDAPESGVVSLIDLATNLEDPLYNRATLIRNPQVTFVAGREHLTIDEPCER